MRLPKPGRLPAFALCSSGLPFLFIRRKTAYSWGGLGGWRPSVPVRSQGHWVLDLGGKGLSLLLWRGKLRPRECPQLVRAHSPGASAAPHGVLLKGPPGLLLAGVCAVCPTVGVGA